MQAKKIVFILMVCSVTVLSAPVARAEAWGSNMAAAFMKQSLEVIQRQIDGVLLGTLKMTAMNMLNSQVGQLIGGGATGAPRFITNWEDALITTPQRNAQLYMNDFFTLTTRGMASSANYVGTGDFGIGGGNYAQYLTRVGESAISGGGQQVMTLHEYTPSPTVLFQQGDWRAFDALVSNPLNNPYGYSVAAEQAYQTKLEKEKEIARTQAIAYQGFKGTEGPGRTITTPGITIKGIVDNSSDFGNKIIAGASNPSELLSSLAATAVNKAINGLVQRGIGEVQSQINRQIGAANTQARSIVIDATRALGPGAQFLPEIQRGVSVNTDFLRVSP